MNVYERAEAVIENEKPEVFLAHLACQLDNPDHDPVLSAALKDMLCDIGYVDVLRRVERDYA